MNRKLLSALAVTMTVGLVVGCSSGGDKPSTDTATSAAQDEATSAPAEEATSDAAAPAADGVEISYWLWDAAQRPQYEECATDFMAANPGITVKVEQFGWNDYWTNLTTNMVAGTAADVFTDHLARYPDFAANGQILDLAPYIQADGVDTSIYQDLLLNVWKGQNGEQYGLPKDWDTIALVYNVDLITEAGYTASDLAELAWNPTDGGTYEKVLAHLTIDKNGVRGDEAGFDPKNVDVYGLGLPGVGGGMGQSEWSQYAVSNGWYYDNTNPWPSEFYYSDPKFKETIGWWRSLIEKGYMPSLEIAVSTDGAQDPFGAGKIAMAPIGDWAANAYFSQEGITAAFAPTPIGPTGKRASAFNGLSDAIYAGTQHPDEAWQWVKYLASPECQMKVAEYATVFPAIKEATEKAAQAFKDKGMDMSAFTIHVDEGTTFLLPIADHWGDINDTIMTPTLEGIMSFTSDVDALDDANAQINALF